MIVLIVHSLSSHCVRQKLRDAEKPPDMILIAKHNWNLTQLSGAAPAWSAVCGLTPQYVDNDRNYFCCLHTTFMELHILFSSQHLWTLMNGLRDISGLKYSSARIRNCRIHVNSSGQAGGALQSPVLVPRQRGCSHFMTGSHYLRFSDIYYIFAVTAHKQQCRAARKFFTKSWLNNFKSFPWSEISPFCCWGWAIFRFASGIWHAQSDTMYIFVIQLCGWWLHYAVFIGMFYIWPMLECKQGFCSALIVLIRLTFQPRLRCDNGGKIGSFNPLKQTLSDGRWGIELHADTCKVGRVKAAKHIFMSNNYGNNTDTELRPRPPAGLSTHGTAASTRREMEIKF